MKTTMQTYFDYIRNRFGDRYVPENAEQWIEMEKKQIIEAVEYGNLNYRYNESAHITGENYYKETYNK